MEQLQDLANRRGVSSINGVDLKLVDAFRNERATAGIEPKTLYGETTIIRQVVNFALSRGTLHVDPVKGLKLAKPKPTRQPCWTYAQLQTILSTCPVEIKPALTLLAETGMRFGEMAWLTWDDVDDIANVLRVRPKEGWKPKTGDQRAVPLTVTLKQLLASLPRSSRWVATMPPSPGHRHAGRQWTERRLLAALKRVLKELGLPSHIHTFRHTFISNALLKHTPTAVVREWVGQVDEEIMKLHAHVHNDASQAAMQRLAEAYIPLQQVEKTRDDAGSVSAQVQHSGKEKPNGRDTK
jgi:integrase